MSVRSDRLSGPTNVPATATNQVLFTVPAGETWIVKSITVYNSGLATGVIYVGARAPGSAIQASLFDASVAASRSAQQFGWVALDAGCIVNATSLTVAAVILITGAKLLGTAP